MSENGSNGRAFEWWMISSLAIGAGYSAFVALLIPPYVTELSGNAAEAGLVMAVLSLAAILGPVIGSFADRYHAHRLALTGGVFGMALSFLMFSISAASSAFYALDAIIMGVSVAAVSAVAPVFIVGTDLSKELQAKQLTSFNVIAPIGQVLGGLLIGAAVSAGWSFSQRFLLSAAVMFVAFLITWFTSAGPAKRIKVADPSEAGPGEEKPKQIGLKAVLISTFGMYLLVLTLSSVANNGINNQLANILPNVYGASPAATSTLLSIAGALNIVFFFLAGRWMGRGNPLHVQQAGHIARLVGALGLAVLGILSSAPLLLVAAFVLILYQGNPYVRLSQPVVAVRFATFPAGQASGWVIGASAIGSFVGSMLGGWLGDSVGFNAINWMAAIAAGLAVLLMFISLYATDRRLGENESTGKAVS
jgi:predicted MFS family arabinose efflux permease